MVHQISCVSEITKNMLTTLVLKLGSVSVLLKRSFTYRSFQDGDKQPNDADSMMEAVCQVWCTSDVFDVEAAKKIVNEVSQAHTKGSSLQSTKSTQFQ